MQITLLGGAATLLTPGSARDLADARRQLCEDRIEVFHHVRARRRSSCSSLAPVPTRRRSSRHPHSGSSWRALCAPDVVDVIRVSAVDENISGFEKEDEIGDGPVHDGRWNHHPNRTRFRPAASPARRTRKTPPSPASAIHRLWRHIEDDAFVARSSSRRTMFAPILPRPIIPSCMMCFLHGHA